MLVVAICCLVWPRAFSVDTEDLPPRALLVAPPQRQEDSPEAPFPTLDESSLKDVAEVPTPPPDSACAHGFMSPLLAHFMDIDFIEFVTTTHPKPSSGAVVIDVGLYQADEVILMAQRGFTVFGFEPEPYRYKKCMEQLNQTASSIRSRVTIRNAAISMSDQKMYFQLAGLDSHMYIPKAGEPLLEKTVVVETVRMQDVAAQHREIYFLKIDTQGFDTTIVESLFPILEAGAVSINFIQFEFTAYFERTRAGRTKEQHKKMFLRMQQLGYDLYQGATVQPWLRSHRNVYGKTPLSMLAIDPNVPTCVDDLVEHLHRSKDVPIKPGSTSTVMGSWMDILAVKRMKKTKYYRHTGWVLARRM